MLSSLPATALSCDSIACTPPRSQCCFVHRRQLPLQSSQQTCRVPHVAPHHGGALTRRSIVQGGSVSVRCAAPANEQPDGQSLREVSKQCLMCGATHTLFYFPVRKSHPSGWVHCYACQYKLWLQAKPPRRVEDDEYAPTNDPQDCSQCHRHLAASWFHLNPKQFGGRAITCMACEADRKRGYARRQRQTPPQKKCRRCHQVLKAERFNRTNLNADGLRGVCIECQKAIRDEYRQPLTSVAVPSKQCCRCGVDKPAAAFDISRAHVDGLKHECKDCCRVSLRQHRQQRRHRQRQQPQPQP